MLNPRAIVCPAGALSCNSVLSGFGCAALSRKLIDGFAAAAHWLSAISKLTGFDIAFTLGKLLIAKLPSATGTIMFDWISHRFGTWISHSLPMQTLPTPTK